jgi:DNA-binding response OmpR family regulator
MAKLLCVDDEPLVLRALVRSLSGHDVATATGLVSTAGYDCAVLDWDPYGEVMVRNCRAAGTPFIVLTGTPERAPAGVRVIAKPFDLDELRAAITAACEVKK